MKRRYYPGPNDDYRSNAFIRMWRLLVLLRRRPHTLDELAGELAVSTRTVRRDLKALQAVPFPISDDVDQDAEVEARVWSMTECPSWPRRAVAPTAEVGR